MNTDISSENIIRPQNLEDFTGQENVRQQLKMIIVAAKKRRETVDHILFSGPPGLGKTTLSYIVAREMGAQIRTTTGPLLEKPSDLVGLLTGMKDGDVLFIDEIHRVHRSVEEYLYGAMEDGIIDIILDKGMNARSVSLSLPPFTLIGATTRAGLLSEPLRSRFGLITYLDYYTEKEIDAIICRAASLLSIGIDENAVRIVAKRARGVARIATKLLKRVRDFVQVKRQESFIYADDAEQAMALLQVDEEGLEKLDIVILKAIYDKFSGGPVGLKTLSYAVGEEAETIEQTREPYLIFRGFLERTARGRCITQKGVEAIEKTVITSCGS